MGNKIHEMSLEDLMQVMGQAQSGSIAHGEASAEFNRRQFRNAQRSMTISILSAVIATVSALATWSGIEYTHREARISASVDFARKHLSDAQLAAGRDLAQAAIAGVKQVSNLSPKEIDNWNYFLFEGHYLARLLAKNRIDRDYLNKLTLCDPWLSFAAGQLLSRGGPEDLSTPEYSIAKELEPECGSYYKKLKNSSTSQGEAG